MIEHSQFVDGESLRVWFFAAASSGLNFAQVNAGLTTVILVGTAIYTWRKALRRHRGRRDKL